MTRTLTFDTAVNFLLGCFAVVVDDNVLTYPAELDDGEGSIYFDSDQYDDSDRTVLTRDQNENVEFDPDTGGFSFKDENNETVILTGLIKVLDIP